MAMTMPEDAATPMKRDPRQHLDPAAIADGLRPMAVAVPVLDMRTRPDAATLDSQLVWGERVACAAIHDDWALVQVLTDGRVGHVPASGLVEAAGMPAPSHRVRAHGTHLYAEPAVKARTLAHLPAPAVVSVAEEVAAAGTTSLFARLADGSGYVPASCLTPLDTPAPDWVAEAEAYLGVPYLWGGRSGAGLDCSALIQLAMAAAHLPCLRDSDQQEGAGWPVLPPDAPLKRGDVVFWRGHVGVMLDGTRLLHANAFHMATAIEPLAKTAARIDDSGGGTITTIRRPACAKLGE